MAEAIEVDNLITNLKNLNEDQYAYFKKALAHFDSEKAVQVATKEETLIHDQVMEYYGKTLNTNDDLVTTACCSFEPADEYLKGLLSKVPQEVVEKFYGCGNPVPYGIKGLNVLDLGSGSGRDCYLAAQMVGEQGSVTGVDMTDEQMAVANAHVEKFCNDLGYAEPNLKFVQGHIEFLSKAGIEAESMDIVISNCVINLSPRKDLVLKEVFKCLKEGGEFHFSDVYCDRRLPQKVREHQVLWGECIAGALYVEDFIRLAREVGFTDPRVLKASPVEITRPDLKEVVGNAKFYSITYRLFKISSLETLCEDYGQFAIYLGTCPGNTHGYYLDDHHFFETNKPMLVCGNSGSMVGDSWLAPYFKFVGSRDTHFGLFDCSPVTTTVKPTGGQKEVMESSATTTEAATSG